MSDRRGVMRQLDACLAALEDANERGEATVGDRLAKRICELVAGIHSDVPISAAIDLVFAEQEKWIGSSESGPAEPIRLKDPATDWEQVLRGIDIVVRPVRLESSDRCKLTIGRDDALRLTADIRRRTEFLALTLLAAHDLGVFKTLGYHSWAEYVQAEFGMSRRRSYEILDQGRVVLGLRAAAGLVDVPHVSAYIASELKDGMNGITQRIRSEVKRNPDRPPMAIVQDVVADARRHLSQINRAQSSRRHSGSTLGVEHPTVRPNGGDVVSALDTLCSASDAGTAEYLVRSLSEEERSELGNAIDRTVRWLRAVQRLLLTNVEVDSANVHLQEYPIATAAG